ncbi:polysaccharide biosynthesis tyrosine autokinase [Sphingobium phenoxybenzoativorans]|uniref:Polysaccharide biosynthesis tyrosine autokinase n=1 Tax=Sphingobium phenoxybenzoativorans TaxID=1592790 RepID=A0A975K4P8_9SPHN|nr:polysaccharide biosynthesis tyrosine autokinase [Sphingobium phenoxybenzoativorans]QUT04339.1 polysaccharide biosynthesis tyrosine autokinase [Sphingobium phenoxybenzoativorans]
MASRTRAEADHISFGHVMMQRFRRLGRAAWRGKAIIFSIIATSLVIGAVVTLMMSSRFTATSRIEVSRDQKKIAPPQGSGVDANQDTDFYNTQYYLLQAQSLAIRVVRVMKLAENDDFFAAHGLSAPGKTEVSTLGKPRFTPQNLGERERLAVQLLEDNIEVKPIRGSSLIDVSYTSRSPVWSARVVNDWIGEFVSSGVERRMASTAGARKFLQRRLAEVRTRIELSERNATLYASMSGIIPLSPGSDGRNGPRQEQTLASTDFAALNDALHKTMVERAVAGSQASGDGSGALAAESSGQTLALLRARRGEAAAEYARLSAKFKPAYPAVAAVARQLKALDESIAGEERRISASFASQARNAAQLENRLRSEVSQSKARLDKQNRDTVQYDIYRRDADTNRALYDGFLERYKQLSVSDVGANDVSVVDLAQVPEKPSSPKLLNNLLLALLSGGLLAGIVTVMLARADNGVEENSDIQEILGIPLLGTTRELEAEDVAELLAEPKSALSEAYARIWSRLSPAGTQDAPGAIMVTSTREHEGKSTSAWGLALAASRSGKKVILVDADMHRPVLHNYMNLENDRGLSNLLSGDDNWKGMVRRTTSGGITLLPAGPVPPGVAELLNGDRMTILIGQLIQAYDHVIVDAPPLLDMQDAPLVARSVQAVVFVVEAGGAGVRAVRSALDRLDGIDAPISGAIMTKLGERNAHYHYDKL